MGFSYVVGKIIQNMQIAQIRNSQIHKTSKVYSKCHVVNSTIEKYSYVTRETDILYSDIGAFCSISGGCVIGGPAHPTDWVSTSPVFQGCSSALKKKFAKIPYEPYRRTIIGNDVWIGNKVLIKAGVKIADGAVIGMGSVVTHDIGPYEIWAGNPAKFIKKRFDDDTIDELLKVQWWNLTDEEIKKFGEFMNKPEQFLEAFSE